MGSTSMENNVDDLEFLCGVSSTNMKNYKDSNEIKDIEFWNQVEIAVLCSQKKILDEMECHSDIQTQLIMLARNIIDGKYAEVLRSKFASDFFTQVNDSVQNENMHIAEWIEKGVLGKITSDGDSTLSTPVGILLIGIACLNLFMQANYTGPTIKASSMEDIYPLVHENAYKQVLEHCHDDDDKEKDEKKTQLHSISLLALHADGEMPYTVCEYPHFLVVARCILRSLANPEYSDWSSSTRTKKEDLNDAQVDLLSYLRTSSWWSGRAAVTHERTLIVNEQPSQILWQEVEDCFQKTRHLFVDETNVNDSSEMAATVLVEWGLAQHFFEDPSKGKHSFRSAQATSGLTVELTGSLGKRTKFQQDNLAQMVLLASSKEIPQDEPSESALASANTTHQDFGGKWKENDSMEDAAYRTISLEKANPDNILLEEINFVDKTLTAQSNLKIIDQVILLALCLDVSNSNPKDGLTHEQMIPYVTRVLQNPNNWMVYSTGLLEKAWLEYERNHSRERGVLQIQALVDQHTTRLTITQNTKAIEEAAPAEERIRFIYALAFPPRWELRKGLADRYFKLGIVRSALEIYEELGLWDEVVECYRLMEKPKRAEEIVRERLAISPSPFLWCCLGDLTNDLSCYHKAWEISKGRYARAKNSLGQKAFQAGDKLTAIAHLQESVAISSCNPASWFLLGVAAIQMEKWALALEAFTCVVQQQPDHGEAWGNIGSVHLHNKNYNGAFAAFQEGLKHKRHMWQMWENLLLSSMRTNHYGDAIYAMHILLELKEKHQRGIDHEMLALLVQRIVYSDDSLFTDKDEVVIDDCVIQPSVTPPLSTSNYKKQLAQLLGRIVANVSSDPMVWRIYADFNYGIGKKDKALDCRIKECRAFQSAGWERDADKVDLVASAAETLCKAYLEEGSSRSLYAARMFLRGIIKKIEMDYKDSDAWKQLNLTMDIIEKEVQAASTT